MKPSRKTSAGKAAIDDKRFPKDAGYRKKYVDDLHQKLAASEQGKLDDDARDIVRSIAIKKNPGLMDKIRTAKEMVRSGYALTSESGLVPADKERILRAVVEFDRGFLKSLIKAMDLADKGWIFEKSKSFAVVQVHALYELHFKKTPTIDELVKWLKKQRGITMDARTLRWLCEHNDLPVLPDKVGRRRKSVVSENPTS